MGSIHIYGQHWDPYIYIARGKNPKYPAWWTFPCVDTSGHRTFPDSQQTAWCPFSVNIVHSPPRPPHPTHIHTPSIILILSLINDLGCFWNFTQMWACHRDSFMPSSFAQCDDSEIQLCVNQQFAALIGWIFTWRWTVGCFQVWLL